MSRSVRAACSSQREPRLGNIHLTCHSLQAKLQFRTCPAIEVRFNALIFAQPLPHGCSIRLRAVAGNEHAPLFAVLDNRARCAAVGEQFRFLPRGILVGENTGLDGVPRFRRKRDFPRDDCLVIGGGNRRGGRLRNRLRCQVRRGVARDSQRTRRKNQQHQHNHAPQPPARHLLPVKPLFHASHVLRLHFLGSGRRYARAERK